MKPKSTTGEWTAERVRRYASLVQGTLTEAQCQRLADDINAELESAKRESAKEIAAEHEQVKEWKRAHKAVSELADGAIHRRQQSERQLAAERENYALALQMSRIESKRANEVIRLLEYKEKELATAQQPLVDALYDMRGYDHDRVDAALAKIAIDYATRKEGDATLPSAHATNPVQSLTRNATCTESEAAPTVQPAGAATEVVQLPHFYAYSHEPTPRKLWDEDDMREYAAALENHEERYETQEEHHLSENRAFRGEIQQLRAQLADANADCKCANEHYAESQRQLEAARAEVTRLAWNAKTQEEAIAAAQQPLVELLEQVLSETVDARDYPDGPCLNADTRTEIKVELAKVKEGK